MAKRGWKIKVIDEAGKSFERQKWSNGSDPGRPITQLLLFSIPLVLGTLFQQLYNFVDAIMVGRLISTNALASAGTTYSMNLLILGFVQGRA